MLLSFFITDYGFAGAEFVGFDNFIDLLSDRFFQRASWNTVAFTLMATVSEVGLGLMVALIVNRKFRGRWIVIPTLIAPFVLSTMVVTAIWRAWFHYDFGFLNNALRAAASLPPVEWLFDPDLALFSVVLVDLWQTAPLTFLILLAGLQSIPAEVYEAAHLDGAKPRQVFLTITVPMLTAAPAAGGPAAQRRQLQDLRQGLRADRRRAGQRHRDAFPCTSTGWASASSTSVWPRPPRW